MAATNNITLRINDQLKAQLDKMGEGSVNRGVITAMSKLNALTAMADNELKGMFTENEWKFFADSLNGVLANDSFRYSTSALIAHNEDAQLYEKIADKWEVNIEELNGKVSRLTSAQVDALYRRVERYWELSPEFDEWAKW